MNEDVFETFIRHCGTLNQAAKVLGISREHVSAMKRGVIHIHLKYALLIKKYMREKANIIIDPLDLLSPYDRNTLKKLTLFPTESSIKLIKISVNNVIFDQEKIESTTRNHISLNALRPIIIDENKKIIANSPTYLSYLQQNKKTVPAWQLCFQDLLEKKYSTELLKQTFLICERASIGIALKKHLGNRQGERSDLKLRRNFDEVKGRTDDLLASLLALKNKDTYRQVEKIQLLGSEELIQSVNNKNITIANAIKLVQQPHKRKKRLITFPKKETPNFICRKKIKV